MTPIFRIEMFAVAIVFFVFVIRLINRNKLSLKRATSLVALSIGLIVFSVWPQLAGVISEFFGFETTSNFLYFCAIIFLLVFLILQSMVLSVQEEKIKNMIQEISIIKSCKERDIK
jgi:hypothetical protein